MSEYYFWSSDEEYEVGDEYEENIDENHISKKILEDNTNYKLKINEDFECSICLDEIYLGVMNKKCKHKFCRDCAKRLMMASKDSCAYCRGPFNWTNVEYFRSKLQIDLDKKLEKARMKKKMEAIMPLLQQKIDQLEFMKQFQRIK